MPLTLKRLKLSIRALMLIVLCLGVWLGWRVHLARQQREAVEAIKKYGGFVAYDWEFVGKKRPPGRSPKAPAWLRRAIGDEFFQDVVEVNLAYGDGPDGKRVDNVRVTDDVMATVRGFPRLRFLYIKETQATDRAMDVVAELAGLETLMMWDAAVTDAGVAKLRSLAGLKQIHINNSSIGDDSLKHLSALPKLEYMSLQGNRFTDAGLAHIRDMKQLRGFTPDLGGDGITDAGMPHLKGLTGLERLGLQGSRVTDAGVRQLGGLTNLGEIWVGGSLVTEEGKAWLRENLPNLKTIR